MKHTEVLLRALVIGIFAGLVQQKGDSKIRTV